MRERDPLGSIIYVLRDNSHTQKVIGGATGHKVINFPLNLLDDLNLLCVIHILFVVWSMRVFNIYFF